eukprot:2190721-Alexandrium_andersonii.AAC.1
MLRGGPEAPTRDRTRDAGEKTRGQGKLRRGVGSQASAPPASQLGEGAPNGLGLKVRTVASHRGPEVGRLE